MSIDLNSMDKAIELGMSLAIAGQIASTMNQFTSQTQIPVIDGTRQQTVGNTFYAVIDGKQIGSYTLSELLSLIQDRKVVRESYI